MNNFNKQFDFFKNAMASGKLAHGYVLSGLNEMAFVQKLSQHIMCKQEQAGCGSCSSCLKLASQNHPDYMVVVPDGASVKNAQIEALQSFFLIKPFESRYKIGLVSHAHLMTDQAQNRLLKLLEEPPEYALIFFITDQITGLLETVLSRCQTVNFEQDSDQMSFESEITEKAVAFVLSLEYKDAGSILDFATYAKSDKEAFGHFLNRSTSLLRDVLIILEINTTQLVSQENKELFEERSPLKRLIPKLSKKDVMDWIHAIDQAQHKIKNNMNFDLTVDQLLFECIN